MAVPVALFVYNRLWHTQQTIQSLSRNTLASETDLIIYSDGPKTSAESEAVKTVRAYIHQVAGFKSVTVHESEANKGLAKSIIGGVTDALKQHPSVIVLEDDMETSPYFLSYMNQALALYQDDEDVIAIHAYIYPVKANLPETFFLKSAHCWGWGTWQRGWKYFQPDGQILLDELKAKNLTYEFDYDDAYPFTKMLEDQIAGRNNSWAIRWQASAFLNNKLTLYPSVSFVRNIGFDTSGTHSVPKDIVYDVKVSDRPVALVRIPKEASAIGRNAISVFFKSLKKTIIQRAFRKMMSIMQWTIKTAK